MPIDHVGLYTRDLDTMLKFYTKALAPLGCAFILARDVPIGLMKVLNSYQEKVRPVPHVIGMGCNYKPDFWLSGPPKDGTEPKSPTTPIHLAFSTNSRQVVRDFYRAAIEAGAKDNGPPGLRPQYFYTYYGAFVLDPEGRNMEVVCLLPGILSETYGWYGWGGNVASLIAIIAAGFGVWSKWYA